MTAVRLVNFSCQLAGNWKCQIGILPRNGIYCSHRVRARGGVNILLLLLYVIFSKFLFKFFQGLIAGLKFGEDGTIEFIFYQP
jgi:hypothetical protein